MDGILFFFPCLTGLGTKSTERKEEEQQKEIRPAIAYFIVFEQSPSTNAEKIFEILHDAELEATVNPLKKLGKIVNTSNYMQALNQVLKVILFF